MPTPDDLELDPRGAERIRARTLARGEQIRKRTRMLRRSAILAGLAVMAAGGVAIASVGAPAALRHQVPAGPSTTSTSTTTSSVPGTTIPFTTTTVPRPTTTTRPPGSTTTTTIPPTTTTTTIPFTKTFSKTLDTVVAPGTVQSATWTVPTSTTADLAKLTLADTGGGQEGQLRVQLLQSGGQPETLLMTNPADVRSPFSTSFGTYLLLQPGQQIALTVSCDADQAACEAELSLSGLLSQSEVGADFSSLEDVVAPGTMQASVWAPPAGDSFSITDLVLSALGTSSGRVRLQVLPSGGAPQTILSMALSTLDGRPLYDAPSPWIQLSAGDQLELTVTCNANQSACNAATLFSGLLSPGSTTTTIPPGTTTTTTTIPFSG